MSVFLLFRNIKYLLSAIIRKSAVFILWGLSVSSVNAYSATFVPYKQAYQLCNDYRSYIDLKVYAAQLANEKSTLAQRYYSDYYSMAENAHKWFINDWKEFKSWRPGLSINLQQFVAWCRKQNRKKLKKYGSYEHPKTGGVNLDLKGFLKGATFVDKNGNIIKRPEQKAIKKFTVSVISSPYFHYWSKTLGGKKIPWFKYMELMGKATWIDEGVKKPAVLTPIDVDLIRENKVIKSYHLQSDLHGKFHVKFMMNPDGNGTKQLFVPIRLVLKGKKKPPAVKKVDGKLVVQSSYEVMVQTTGGRYFTKWYESVLGPNPTDVRQIELMGHVTWKDGNSIKPARWVPITLKVRKDGRTIHMKTVYSNRSGRFLYSLKVNPVGTKSVTRQVTISLRLRGKERPKDFILTDKKSVSEGWSDDLPPEYRKKLSTDPKLLKLWIKLLYLKAIYDDAMNRAKLGKGTPNLDALKKDIQSGKEYRAALRMIMELASSKTEEVAGTGGKVSDVNDKLQKLQELFGKKKKGSYWEQTAKTIRHYIDYTDYTISR